MFGYGIKTTIDMKTKFNINDVVWLVGLKETGRYKPCNNCDNNGKITIKETDKKITCLDCNGTKEIDTGSGGLVPTTYKGKVVDILMKSSINGRVIGHDEVDFNENFDDIDTDIRYGIVLEKPLNRDSGILKYEYEYNVYKTKKEADKNHPKGIMGFC